MMLLQPTGSLPVVVSEFAPLRRTRRYEVEDAEATLEEDALGFVFAGTMYVHPDRWAELKARVTRRVCPG